MEIPLAHFCRYSTGLDGDRCVAPIEQPQHRNEVRLRLNRYYTSTDPAENAYPIAHVGSNVESQIAGLKELPVERLHPVATPDRAVIGDHRTSDPESAADQGSR